MPKLPLYHPATPSALKVFHKQSKGPLYKTPRTRPVTGSLIVFSAMISAKGLTLSPERCFAMLTVVRSRENLDHERGTRAVQPGLLTVSAGLEERVVNTALKDFLLGHSLHSGALHAASDLQLMRPMPDDVPRKPQRLRWQSKRCQSRQVTSLVQPGRLWRSCTKAIALMSPIQR